MVGRASDQKRKGREISTSWSESVKGRKPWLESRPKTREIVYKLHSLRKMTNCAVWLASYLLKGGQLYPFRPKHSFCSGKATDQPLLQPWYKSPTNRGPGWGVVHAQVAPTLTKTAVSLKYGFNLCCCSWGEFVVRPAALPVDKAASSKTLAAGVAGPGSRVEDTLLQTPLRSTAYCALGASSPGQTATAQGRHSQQHQSIAPSHPWWWTRSCMVRWIKGWVL